MIDTTTGLVVDTIHVPEGPNSVTFSPDGQRAYVTHGQGGIVSVIVIG